MKHFAWVLSAGLFVSGCTTVSEKQVFESLEKESGTNVVWIKNPKNAQEVYENVSKILSEPLSEENALKVALINNRTLQKAYADVGVSYGELVQAGLLSNPVLGYSIGHGGGISTQTLSIEWAFLDLMMIPLKKELAGLALEETKLRVGEEIHQTLKNVQLAYWDAFISEKKMALIEELLISQETTYQLALRQNAAGNLSMRDLQKVRDHYAHVRLEMFRARHGANAMRENLNRLLGLYGKETEYRFAKQDIFVPKILEDNRNTEQEALERRLEMRAAHQKVLLRAKEAGFIEKTSYLGELTLSAEREKTTNEEPFKTYSIAVPLPIFNRSEGELSRSEALYNQSLQELYETAVTIRSDVRESLSKRYYAHSIAREFKDVILPANQKILEETGLFYNGMLDGIYELLEDQRRLSEAKIDALEAMGEYRKSEIELLYVVGMIPKNAKGENGKE